jgi:small-conductance mechanosensitive channel
MEFLDQIVASLPKFLPFLIALAVVAVVLRLGNWFLLTRKKELGEEQRFPRRIAMLLLTGLGIVSVLLVLPIDPDNRGQLLAVLGLLLTAIIALSSTTFVANAMSGLMLRAVRSFRPGDFVQVEEQFGRVTERGLFHTEIQTQERDLVTLPNLYLVTNPIRVVRSSGTIVSATVSLGYDKPHDHIENLLTEAALAAKLQDPFVQIKHLGDFAITYRVNGFLADVKQLLTARSRLRASMLDALHGGGIEIVSPTFMSQRPLKEGTVTMPPVTRKRKKEAEKPDYIPEELIFDKAEAAEKSELLRRKRDEFLKDAAKLEGRLKEAGEEERSRLESRIELLKNRAEYIGKMLDSGGGEEGA